MDIGLQVLLLYVFRTYTRNRGSASWNFYRESLPDLLT